MLMQASGTAQVETRQPTEAASLENEPLEVLRITEEGEETTQPICDIDTSQQQQTQVTNAETIAQISNEQQHESKIESEPEMSTNILPQEETENLLSTNKPEESLDGNLDDTVAVTNEEVEEQMVEPISIKKQVSLIDADIKEYDLLLEFQPVEKRGSLGIQNFADDLVAEVFNSVNTQIDDGDNAAEPNTFADIGKLLADHEPAEEVIKAAEASDVEAEVPVVEDVIEATAAENRKTQPELGENSEGLLMAVAGIEVPENRSESEECKNGFLVTTVAGIEPPQNTNSSDSYSSVTVAGIPPPTITYEETEVTSPQAEEQQLDSQALSIENENTQQKNTAWISEEDLVSEPLFTTPPVLEEPKNLLPGVVQLSDVNVEDGNSPQSLPVVAGNSHHSLPVVTGNNSGCQASEEHEYIEILPDEAAHADSIATPP